MKLAVLVSGSGTNLAALISARDRKQLGPAEIAVVVSNRPGVQALERARAANIPALTIDHRKFTDRQSFEDSLLEALATHQVMGDGGVILAGFMRILTARFVKVFPNRIINTHPALCPAFPGIDAPAQAIAHGAQVTGCTVHFVDSGVDTGPIIFQAALDIAPNDTAKSLHQRIQVLEHQLLPRAAKLLAQGRLHVEQRRVRIVPPRTTDR